MVVKRIRGYHIKLIRSCVILFFKDVSFFVFILNLLLYWFNLPLTLFSLVFTNLVFLHITTLGILF